MKYLRFTVAALALVSLSGCDLLGILEDSGPSFGVDKTVYVAGEQAVLTLKNNSSRELGFNLSCSILEPQEGQSLPAEVREGACVQYLGILALGQETRLPYTLHVALPAGLYRFSTKVYKGKDLNEKDTMFTNSFEVTK